MADLKHIRYLQSTIRNLPMFSSRNIHFAILGLILGASSGYIFAFYQAEVSFVPKTPTQQQASQTGTPPNHPNVTPDDVGIGAEALAPEPVAQEHDVLLAWLTLIGSEITPKPDPFAEDAMPAARATAHYRAKAPGGSGAFRDFAEWIMKYRR